MGRPPIQRTSRPAAAAVLSATRTGDPASTQRAVEETAEAVRDLQRAPVAPRTGSAGDIMYRARDGSIVQLPIGTAGQVLTVVGGLPEWV